MNILFTNEVPFIPTQGGVERVSDLLAREFQQQGHKVKFFSLADPAEKFQQILKNENIDVIINQTKIAEMIALLKSVDRGKTRIFSVIHNQPFCTYGKERIYKRLVTPETIKSKILGYIGIIFPSFYRRGRTKFEINRINELLSVSDKILLLSEKYIPRVKMIMPDVDISRFGAINNPNTFDNRETELRKENLVLFVGRLYDPQKNVTGFIDVWKNFSCRYPGWKAVIAGDGPDREKLEKYVQKRRIRNLEFAGNHKEIHQLYSKAKMLCMTSLYEGWPMVLAEAMHYGCVPVLYNTFEAAEDIVTNEESGILIPSIDSKMMTERLAYLAENEPERSKMGRNGCENIKKFNISRIAVKWLDLWR